MFVGRCYLDLDDRIGGGHVFGGVADLSDDVG